MVLCNKQNRIAFENIDLKHLTYSDLAAIKEQIKTNLRAVQNEMADREMCPEYDEEIEAWKKKRSGTMANEKDVIKVVTETIKMTDDEKAEFIKLGRSAKAPIMFNPSQINSGHFLTFGSTPASIRKEVKKACHEWIKENKE